MAADGQGRVNQRQRFMPIFLLASTACVMYLIYNQGVADGKAASERLQYRSSLQENAAVKVNTTEASIPRNISRPRVPDIILRDEGEKEAGLTVREKNKEVGSTVRENKEEEESAVALRPINAIDVTNSTNMGAAHVTNAGPAKGIAILIATVPTRICEHYSNLARMSVNLQTVRPSRVILGMSFDRNLTTVEQGCVGSFRDALDVPLSVSLIMGKKSAGGSRNAALQLLGGDEGALMHDDDEYVHPQSIELLRWLFASNKQDVFVFSLLGGWGMDNATKNNSLSPWCIGKNFSALYKTDEVYKIKKKVNIQAMPDPKDKEARTNVVHGYPAFRRSPIVQFGVKYTDKKHTEDADYLTALMNKGASFLFTSFPIMAYRSKGIDAARVASGISRREPICERACNKWRGFACFENRNRRRTR
jgi:hypothetical protein